MRALKIAFAKDNGQAQSAHSQLLMLHAVSMPVYYSAWLILFLLADITRLQMPSHLSIAPELCMPAGFGLLIHARRYRAITNSRVYVPIGHKHSRVPKCNGTCCYSQLIFPQRIPGELRRRPHKASKGISNIYTFFDRLKRY